MLEYLVFSLKTTNKFNGLIKSRNPTLNIESGWQLTAILVKNLNRYQLILILNKWKLYFRKLLNKDADKNEVDPKQAHQDLTDKCRITADIKTPKILQAVSKLLPPTSDVKKQLETVLGRMFFTLIITFRL